MKARDSGGDINFEPAPVGMHIARCIRLIDLGTTMDDYWGREKHQIFIMWEIPGEMKTYTVKEDGKADREVTEPFTVSKFYTVSLSDKAHLRHDLESWRSKAFTEAELEGFELKGILGAPCMVNVIHTEKKRGGIGAVVKSVTGMPKGLECPPMVHDKVYFSMDDGEFDPKELEKVSKGLRQQIERSNEYKAIFTGQPVQGSQAEGFAEPVSDDQFDDIPF
jgi:hypothetical protein